jgi:hypothetical protein
MSRLSDQGQEDRIEDVVVVMPNGERLPGPSDALGKVQGPDFIHPQITKGCPKAESEGQNQKQ